MVGGQNKDLKLSKTGNEFLNLYAILDRKLQNNC